MCDSRTSCHTSYFLIGIMNYRESNAYMRTASGARYPIDGYGDLPLTFQSSYLPLLLRNVARVPSLNYHIFSLRAVADKGHTYTGNHERVVWIHASGTVPYARGLTSVSICYSHWDGFYSSLSSIVCHHAQSVVPLLCVVFGCYTFVGLREVLLRGTVMCHLGQR